MEETNKLIAEFMGFTKEKNLGYYDNNMNMAQVVYDVQNGNCFDELLFDKSWDWLMPVVEKIENLSYGKWYVHIQGNSVSIEDGNDSPIWDYHVNSHSPTLSLFSTSLFSENKNNTPIASLYKAVVEFIKYYNKIKNKEL
tara:strand:+ start:1679 stop:2098 length:420 start_codon:yes stop_codon:yes gene_type:complete